MPSPEIENDIVIRVGEISVEGNPNHRETPCACGGMLIYKAAPFSTSWNGQHLRVEKVWGYRCSNNPGCSVTLLLPEVSEELERHIDEALGRSCA